MKKFAASGLLAVCIGITALCAAVHVGIAVYHYPKILTAVPLWMIVAGITVCWAAILLVCLGIIFVISKFFKK